MTQLFIPETNISSLAALNYFAFYRQYRIFDASALPYFQKCVSIRNEVIMLLSQKDTIENIIVKLQNSKVGLLDALQIEIRPLLAYSCLIQSEVFEGKQIPISYNIANDEDLNKLALEIYYAADLPYLHLITEVGLVFDKLQKQLSKAFPKMFETDITPFLAAQDAIRRMDVEDENSLIEELNTIQTIFLQAHKHLALISEEQNFDDAYWTQIFMLAENIGMSQEDLRKNSIHFFYAKLQNKQDANKRMQEVNSKV